MSTRKEMIMAVGARYRDATVNDKSTILDEVVAITGYHRKHATRVLGTANSCDPPAPVRNRLYDEAVATRAEWLEASIVLLIVFEIVMAFVRG